MEEDIIKEAKEKRDNYLAEKIEKRKMGLGDRSHLFIWTKRIVNILNKQGKQTIDQIYLRLTKDFPKDYENLNEEEIKNSVRSVLNSLIKKTKLKNIRGVKSNLIYGFGLNLRNNGKYWWLENLSYRPEDRMKEILALFKETKK